MATSPSRQRMERLAPQSQSQNLALIGFELTRVDTGTQQFRIISISCGMWPRSVYFEAVSGRCLGSRCGDLEVRALLGGSLVLDCLGRIRCELGLCGALPATVEINKLPPIHRLRELQVFGPREARCAWWELATKVKHKATCKCFFWTIRWMQGCTDIRVFHS